LTPRLGRENGLALPPAAATTSVTGQARSSFQALIHSE
jgi:hypothetical protein